MPVLPGNNAGTYCPNDAINLVQAFGHGIPMTTIQANVCDIINSMIWCFYPWSWSVAPLTAITLTTMTQDFVATDTNILRPIHIQIVRTDTTPNEWRELVFLDNLSQELSRTGGLDTIKACGYFASTNTFRLDRAVQFAPPQTMQLQGIFQQIPTKITEKNLQVPFLFPDRFYNCFVEGLKWKIYQLSDDQRAGGITISKNGNMMRQYSGQFGIFWEELIQMSRTEDLSHGDDFQFPEAPFGSSHSYWPGLYGL